MSSEGFDTDRSGPAPSFLNYGYQIPAETPISNAYDVLDAAIEAGFVVKADTIEDLAGKLGIGRRHPQGHCRHLQRLL